MTAFPLPIPPPHAAPLRCRWCGNMLGLVADGVYYMQHGGRSVVMHLPGRITCEKRLRRDEYCQQETLVDTDGSTR